ncbi:hypothetical protein C0995_012339 [Termitomyces sp. Mi166|nr:hypothetical protein C0995_012339 [Termitomyces sp. Mi166\
MAEMFWLRIAGSDITSNMLLYFFWKLSCCVDILKKLQVEIDEVMPDVVIIPDISVLQELSYPSAFIKIYTYTLQSQVLSNMQY